MDGINKNGEFTGACPEDRSFGTDNIAGIKASVDFIRFCAYIVPSDVDLNSAFTVLQMCETTFSMVALRHDPTGDSDFLGFVGCFLNVSKVSVNGGSRVCRFIFMWIRLYAKVANFV